MDNSPYKNFNSSKNKDKYYSNLIEYNKKLHKNNQNLESKINSEIKIYEKPSILKDSKNSTQNQLLSVISHQKNTSNEINLNEIELKPNISLINKDKTKTNDQKSFKEKKMEENLELKYGKGYKILKMAGYQLGKGLGKEEQGITDPILVKKRKERAGINNQEENEESFDMGKDNNFILGKKRMNEEKAYEETNEEFKNFDLILEEYTKDKNSEKIWNLLDEDRRIKKKYYGKGGRAFGFNNFRKKFKGDFPELKGKEIILKNMENLEKDELKEKIAKMLWVTKDKIVDKLRQYYENENNKFIYEKIHKNTDNEKNKIYENLEDENILLNNLNNTNIYKEPDKHRDLQSIINFIEEYLKLYEANSTLYKKYLNKMSLYCLKTTISFLEEMNLDIKILLDKDNGKQISLIFSKMKKLLNITYNNEDNLIDEDKEDNKYLPNPDKKNNILNNLDIDDIDKAGDYYNMFLSQILFYKLLFFIENKWNVENSKPIINISHIYSEILPKHFIEILNKKVSSSIINYLNKNYHFIYSKNSANNENLKIHTWIHPLLDILSLDALTDILRIIEQKIRHSIKSWNLNNIEESQLLINLLSPWSKLFGEEFWKDLYKKFFSPNFHKMFSELYLNIDEKIENLHCIKLMFTLNERKIIPSKKCSKILKKYFFDKLKIFIKDWNKKYGYNIEKNQIVSNWITDGINYIKTKNNIYEGIKEDLNDCLLYLDKLK